MKMSKGQKIWSIIAAVVTVSAVGIYVFKPGRKKKITPLSLPPVLGKEDSLTSDGQRIQSITTNVTNVNLRSSPSSASKSNIVANVAEKGKYVGNAIEYVPDDDGGEFTWAYVQPQPPFTVLTSPFYVRTDLIKAS